MPGYEDHYFQDYALYSVTFGEYNSWDTWHLIPTGRPSIAPPAVKTNFVEVPGGNGSLDMSNALTGYPTYGDRTGSITFMCLDKRPWQEIYDSILYALHNKSMRMTLSEDPNFYYEGRFEASQWQTNADYSTIDISYTLKPFKTSVESKVVLFDETTFETDTLGNPYFHLELDGVMTKYSQIVNPTMWINGNVAEGDTQVINFRNSELNYYLRTAGTITTEKQVMDNLILSNFCGTNYCNFTMKNYVSGRDVRMIFNEKRL